MKKSLPFIILFLLFSGINAQNPITESSQLEISIDKEVTLEGKVLHVCPINGDKIKLQLSDKEIVTVLHSNRAEGKFDKALSGKTIIVTGVLNMQKLPKSTIDSNYNQRKLLCHLDYKPCIDSVWVAEMWKNGYAQTNLDNTNENLQSKMSATEKDYIPVYYLSAKKISVKQEQTNKVPK